MKNMESEDWRLWSKQLAGLMKEQWHKQKASEFQDDGSVPPETVALRDAF